MDDNKSIILLQSVLATYDSYTSQTSFLRKLKRFGSYTASIFSEEMQYSRPEQYKNDFFAECRAFTVLPYVCGVSESLRRILTSLRVWVCFRPHRTLRQLLSKPKDPVPELQRSGVVVYRVPCAACPASYVGQTAHTRVSEPFLFIFLFIYCCSIPFIFVYPLRYYYFVCCTLLLFHSSYLLIHAFSLLTFLCCLVVTNILISLWSAVLHFFTEDGGCMATETFELSRFWLV